MVSLGIDLGTRSWKAALLREGEILELRQFEGSEEVRHYLLAKAADYPRLPIVLPSGFGIPLKRIQEVNDQDLFEMALRREKPKERGLSQFLSDLRSSDLHAYCIPAVKLLPSIPVHRKVNKVDMGTSDKLCSVAFFEKRLLDQGKTLEEMDFLALEVGEAFRAIVVVKGGKIVDGLGGTAGGIGPRSRGSIDGELAYLSEWKEKALIYSGGALDIEERFGGYGKEAFWEALEKELYMLLGFYRIETILLAGRRKGEVLDQLGRSYCMEALSQEGEGFEAALGAALLANGIAGGQYEPLVVHLGLKEAKERVLDWILR
ncbi:MAG: DUF1464 family protein [Candidatus Methylomirabilales bacterium]